MTLACLGARARLGVVLAGLAAGLFALAEDEARATWLPPVPISGGLQATDPQVAVDGGGNVTVAWVSGASSKDVFVAEHPAGGEWTPPVQRISDPVGANSCETPRLAVNSAGAAIVVADCGSGTTPMRFATRSMFGTWSGGSTEIPGTAEGSDPRPGIDAAGNAVLVWEGPGSTVRSAYRPAGSAWSSVTTLSTKAGGATPLEPKASAATVGMTPDGYAFAVWREKREEFAGDTVVEVRSSRKEKAGAWVPFGAMTNNFTTTPVTTGEPQIAINAADQKLVAWRVENPAVAWFAQTRYSFSALAGWNTAKNISESPQEVEAVKLAIDGSGRGLAVWRSFEAGVFRIRAASTATAGGSWSTPATSLGGPSGITTGSEPAVAVAPDGAGTIVWRSGVLVEAASHPAGGAFDSAVTISDSSSPDFTEPVVAMDSGGNAIAAWATNAAPARIAVAVDDRTPPGVSVAAPAPVQVGDPVSLTASASDSWSPVALSWDFGDGGGANGAAVSHTYASAGTKTATVTATDAAGNRSSTAVSVEVTAPPGPGGGSSAGSGAAGGGPQGGAPPARHRIQVRAAKVVQPWAKQREARALTVKCKLDVEGTCSAVATMTKAVAGKLGLAVPKGRKPVRIGRGSAPATAGRFAAIKVKLNPKALAAISASPNPVPVAIALEGTAAGSDPGTATRRLTLRP